jgi:hypothetical protein
MSLIGHGAKYGPTSDIYTYGAENEYFQTPPSPSVTPILNVNIIFSTYQRTKLKYYFCNWHNFFGFNCLGARRDCYEQPKHVRHHDYLLMNKISLH